MLTVKTYLDRSATHGIGLFADQFIGKGTIVWEFNQLVDLEFDEQTWSRMRRGLSSMCYDALVNYSYKEKNRYILCLDNAQFMNHSSISDNVGQEQGEDIMTAKRDIMRGEELLCDYFAYSDHDDHHVMKIAANQDENAKNQRSRSLQHQSTP